MPSFKAVIFDLDGVITKTSLVHKKAWKEIFNIFLNRWALSHKTPFAPFNDESDYLLYLDGKARYEGVKAFLESRQISLPYGTPSSPPDEESICGIGNMKNIAFNQIIEKEGVETYDSTLKLIRELKKNGKLVAIASSSKNCRKILERAGLSDIVEVRIDGETSARIGLKSKPAPDIFLKAASLLNIPPALCVVVEDANSGVKAGKKGNFGLVLGLARENNKEELYAHGADIVVNDIEEFGYDNIDEWFRKGLPHDNWSITYHGYLQEKERHRETLLSVGNGCFATRGAMEETDQNGINYPGTYMAGCYNKLKSEIGGKNIWNEDFVNVVNWLPINFKLEGEEWFDINSSEINKLHRELTFSDGLLNKTMVVASKQNQGVHIRSQRFVSMAKPNICAIRYEITPEKYKGKITVKSALKGNHINNGVARYSELNQKHLQPVKEWYYDNFQGIEVETTQSEIKIVSTARVEIYKNGILLNIDYQGNCRDGVSEMIATIDLEDDDFISIEKYVFIEQLKNGDESLWHHEAELNGIVSFDALHAESAKAWGELWEKFDIKVENDRLKQKLLRLHMYHLLCTVSPHNVNIDAGVPARGLTGEAYRGHIFWDELYILPIFFTRLPETVKSILMYRYRRLDAARGYARSFGYKGAMFPWQSGSAGEEETQTYHYNPVSGKWDEDYSSLQRHVSLAIAYNIIGYYKATNDTMFMEQYGLEMVIEICRFWCSKAEKNVATGRYSIDGVMGPDEFHEKYPEAAKGGLKDNAYTNVMTAWLFRETASILKSLNSERVDLLLYKLGVANDEPAYWSDISKNLNLVISKEGVIAQFDGYFELEELDMEYYQSKYHDTHRLDRILKAEGKSPDNFKISKQADLLMLFYNLDVKTIAEIISNMNFKLPNDFLKINFDYYIKRTSHGSTLSRVVHAYIAKLAGYDELACNLYTEALLSDYNDIQGGTTSEGIHCGVMAGTILLSNKIDCTFSPIKKLP